MLTYSPHQCSPYAAKASQLHARSLLPRQGRYSEGIHAIMPWLTALLGNTAAPTPTRSPKHGLTYEARPNGAALPGTPSSTIGFKEHVKGKVLLLADAENISYTLRNQGFDCDFGALRQRVSASTAQLHAHAFATVKGDDAHRYAHDYFAREQWVPHINAATTVHTHDGTRLRANSDNEILMCAGELISRIQPDTLVIATGDGDLGCDIAQYFHRRKPSRAVVVCAVQNSTSHRLLATHNPQVKANVWLGWDCIAKAQ